MPRLIYRDSDGIEKTIDLGAEPTLIGRSSECQVQTQDALVSRRHARIIWDGGYWIEDLGSSNGVWIAGERVQKAPVRPGDEVRCGTLVMRLVPDLSRSFQKGPGTVPPPPPPDALTPGKARPSSPNQRAVAPPPAVAVVPPPVVAPVAVAPDLTGPLDEERARRKQAEAAVLTAEQRASTAEARVAEAEQRVRGLEQRVADAEASAQDAAERAKLVEQAAREGEKWRRKAEQLSADMRRLRGGNEEVTNADAASPALIADLTAERDRLQKHVAELEAQLQQRAAAPPPAAGEDAAALRRKVDQLTADLRRLRGGQPAPEADARIPELEAKLAQAERERDEAKRAAEAARAAAAAAPPANEGPSIEVDRLKRVIDQLTAENRRLRQGAGASPAPPVIDDPRVPELTAKLAQAESERDALKRAAAAPAAPAAPSPAVADAIAAIDDALADLRGSLRASMDEVGLLGVEAPSDSVQVLKESVVAATEQMEIARGKVREVRTLLKIPV